MTASYDRNIPKSNMRYTGGNTSVNNSNSLYKASKLLKQSARMKKKDQNQPKTVTISEQVLMSNPARSSSTNLPKGKRSALAIKSAQYSKDRMYMPGNQDVYLQKIVKKYAVH